MKKRLLYGFLLSVLAGVTVIYAAGIKEEKLYREAEELEKRRAFPRAIEKYRKYCLEPTSNRSLAIKARYDIAEILKVQKKYVQSVAELQAFVVSYPYSAWVDDARVSLELLREIPLYDKEALNLFMEAEKDIVIANYEKAIEGYNKVIAGYSTSPLAIIAEFEIGKCYIFSGAPKQAIKTYQRFIEHHPKHKLAGTALFKIGAWEERLGNEEKAFEAYQKVISLYPKSDRVDDAYFELAQSYMKRQKHGEGLKLLQKIVKEYPAGDKVDDAQFDIGLYHYTNINDADRANKALDAFQKLVELYSSSIYAARAQFTIGVIYRDLKKDSTRAVIELQKVIDNYPGDRAVVFAQQFIEMIQQSAKK